jgi:hypothetical protein
MAKKSVKVVKWSKQDTRMLAVTEALFGSGVRQGKVR